ncbi:MAG: cyclase family protein [Flavobacteriales bacterium]|nr:cyclase family protein [Flavobacteriales bacterium]
MKLRLDENSYVLTDQGMDVSLPVKNGSENARAWYCNDVLIEPVVGDGFIGDVNQGGAVNFKNITLNPHGNGTHTECVGHISKEIYTINGCLKEFHFKAKLISIEPKAFQEDLIMDRSMIEAQLTDLGENTALLIRTLPNGDVKRTRDYSASNPPYFTEEAMEFINDLGVKHLLIDLPSVDRESDGGKVACHHIFWDYPNNPQLDKTITELIYVPNEILDGDYFLNIQIMSLENDASPSKIMLYTIHQD